jgi:hypothetical protein
VSRHRNWIIDGDFITEASHPRRRILDITDTNMPDETAERIAQAWNALNEAEQQEAADTRKAMFKITEGDPDRPLVESVEVAFGRPGVNVVAVRLARPGHAFNTFGTTIQLCGRGGGWAEVTCRLPDLPEPGQPLTMHRQKWGCVAGTHTGDVVYEVFIPVQDE